MLAEFAGAQGIVGEEDNTEHPSYPMVEDPLQDGGVTDYEWNQKIDYGYILTQTEKAAPYVESATIWYG